MLDLDRTTMRALFAYDAFIPVLRDAFVGETTAPARAHHDAGGTTVLLMPAWNDRHLGVKTVTVAPDNRERGLPSVHAAYTLFDRGTGAPLARLDGKTLTNLRTAAAPALACDLLAPRYANRLLMIGCGSLAPELIRAHASVRPIQSVRVQARSPEKVQAWLARHDFGDVETDFSIDLVEDVEDFADVICCATTSPTPVFPGRCCRREQHVDLVGSYRPDDREADDDLMARAHVLLDTEQAAVESGDIRIPVETGVLTPDRMLGTLADVLRAGGDTSAPRGAITVFKSVGLALEDLALAEFLYERAAVGDGEPAA